MNPFAYLVFALDLSTSVGLLTVTFMKPGPIAGGELLADVQPALAGLQSVNSKISVPPALAAKVCDAVAETLNDYWKAPAAVQSTSGATAPATV